MKCECDTFTYKCSSTVFLFNPTAVLFVISGIFVHLNILFITEDFLVLFWCNVMPICEKRGTLEHKFTGFLCIYNIYFVKI
jgi:hypothetical protein